MESRQPWQLFGDDAHAFGHSRYINSTEEGELEQILFRGSELCPEMMTTDGRTQLARTRTCRPNQQSIDAAHIGQWWRSKKRLVSVCDTASINMQSRVDRRLIAVSSLGSHAAGMLLRLEAMPMELLQPNALLSADSVILF